MSWSWLGASYHDQIVAPGKQPVFPAAGRPAARLRLHPDQHPARLLARATRRGDRWNHRKSWLVTLIGGAPSQAAPASQGGP